jgi:hypothetical protein
MTTDVIRWHLKAPAIVPMSGFHWRYTTQFGWIRFYQMESSAHVNTNLTGPQVWSLLSSATVNCMECSHMFSFDGFKAHTREAKCSSCRKAEHVAHGMALLFKNGLEVLLTIHFSTLPSCGRQFEPAKRSFRIPPRLTHVKGTIP